ncbi:hypothetical protein Pfo_023672 [Paulownia fortunei]|nr:hypothetical protein Pfo_023672 [Paulownia fortunei]
MASTSFHCSSIQSFDPFSRTQINKPKPNKKICTKTYAARREAHNQNFDGRLVDENLIVLRKRIHEMKMTERNYEPPREWMDWEKQFYASYDSIICDAMGHMALGMIALIALSVPTSTAVVMYNLLELSKLVLSGIHLS